MTKIDVVALLKQNKGFINFPNPLPVKGPKKSVTSIDLHEGQVRVYYENGVSDWDYCESEVQEAINEPLFQTRPDNEHPKLF